MIQNTNLFLMAVNLFIIYNNVVNSLSISEQKAVVDCHNKYRSLLANGKVKNKITGNYFPKGKDIIQLTYSNKVEISAAKWASNCQFDHSEGGGGFGENLYLAGDYNTNFTAVLTDACNMWWGESATDGVPNNWLKTFLDNDDEDTFEKCGHFTQMAWAKTSSVGCAAKLCKNAKTNTFGTLVVCRYDPPGNVIGMPVYQPGNPCSGCGNKGCNNSNKLCYN